MSKMRQTFIAAIFVAAIASACPAQDPKAAAPNASKPPSGAVDARLGREYSGMYSFLQEGEFVQVTVEDDSKVTGFLSRYGDGDSDKGVFLDQYFKSGKLEGNKLIFTTEMVHAVWFEFKGTVERGEGKTREDEGFYVLRGTVIENTSDGAKKVTAHSQEVLLKSFPEETSPAKK